MNVDNRDRSSDFYGDRFQQVAKLPQSLSERDRHIPDLLAKMCKPGPFRLLDIGCGLGKVARCAKDMFLDASVYGLDISSKAIEKARSFRSDIDYRVCGELDLPFDEGFFDYAACRMSIHHYPRILDHLREVRRVLKPGGIYLIMDILPEDAAQADRLNDVFLSADRDAPGDGHLRFRTLPEYEEVLRDAGFSLGDVLYSSFAVKWAKTTDYYRAICRHFERMPREFQEQVRFTDHGENFVYCLRMGSLFARQA
ncbi:MAG: class I SAM-dependent methyltransferase [Phycisphaerae bacterium]|jgi:ubiquinone/menaquinone biosynthesis C-methylase UbiE